MCPGILLARSIMFLTVSSLLWAFEISHPVEGKVIEGEDQALVFKPRHSGLEEVLGLRGL